MKRAWLALAKAIFSAALVVWVISSIDQGALVTGLRQRSFGPLMLAAALFVLQALVIGWRWHRIVEWLGGSLAPRVAIRWVFVGMFFNNALPTSVGGDAVRVWLLNRSGAPLTLSLGSVVIERGTGIVLLGMLITACMPAVWPQLTDESLRLLLASTGPILLTGLAFITIAYKLAGRLMPATVAGPLQSLGSGLRRLALHPPAFAELTALGVAASLLGLLAAYVLGKGLGIPLAFPAYVVLVGGAILLSVLPVSLGGWGMREWGMVSLFGAVGVSAEQALALSLAWGVLPLLISLPAGLIWWANSRRAPDLS
jgi:uncharacterized membrane protein YbhN (UPF0104 family)